MYTGPWGHTCPSSRTARWGESLGPTSQEPVCSWPWLVCTLSHDLYVPCTMICTCHRAMSTCVELDVQSAHRPGHERSINLPSAAIRRRLGGTRGTCCALDIFPLPSRLRKLTPVRTGCFAAVKYYFCFNKGGILSLSVLSPRRGKAQQQKCTSQIIVAVMRGGLLQGAHFTCCSFPFLLLCVHSLLDSKKHGFWLSFPHPHNWPNLGKGNL